MRNNFIALLLILIHQLSGHGFCTKTLIKQGDVYQSITYLFQNHYNQKQLISSYDFNSGALTNRVIKSVGESKSNCYFQISFDNNPNNDIKCTPSQEFYDVNAQHWIPALQLHTKDTLLSAYGTYTITSIKFVKSPLKVYALEIENMHNFFVGTQAILTHNMLIPWALNAGLCLSFGAGAVAGSSAGGCFGPITLIGGAALGGIVGIAIKIFADDERSKYKLYFDVDTIERLNTTFHDTKSKEKTKLPGIGDGWRKLKGDQGWLDEDGSTWKKDQKHKNHAPHWDVSNRKGKKIKEVDYDGNEIWPNGAKNKNKKP